MRIADSVKVAPVLRLGVFACLILALVIGEPAGDDGAPDVVWLDESFGEDAATGEDADAGEGSARSDLLRRVASGDRPGLVVRPHTTPP